MMKRIKTCYEFFMFLCVIVSVGTIWYQSSYDLWIIWGTWGIFLIDYLVRFYFSTDKVQFMKRNPFDLIALIPLDALFQTAKLARLYRLMRLKTIARHYSNPLIRKMSKNKLPYVLLISFIVILISTIPFYYYEPLVRSYGKAFRWALTSFLFFGNSNANPESWIGKIVIIQLTILGLSLHAVIMTMVMRFIRIRVGKKGSQKQDEFL
jgi:voltage-gated potassium channel